MTILMPPPRVFDTRSFFPLETAFGRHIYARFIVDGTSDYKAEFGWAFLRTETRVRTFGSDPGIVDSVRLAFGAGRMDHLDPTMLALCPDFPPAYWMTIRALVPTRRMDA